MRRHARPLASPSDCGQSHEMWGGECVLTSLLPELKVTFRIRGRGKVLSQKPGQRSARP